MSQKNSFVTPNIHQWDQMLHLTFMVHSFFKLLKIIKNSIDTKSTKICNAIPIWHYTVTEDIQHEYSAGAAPSLLQVRQSVYWNGIQKFT